MDTIGFPRVVAYRLAISALSKARAGGRGLAEIIERAMIVQVLLVGLISAMTAALGAPVAGRLLGANWGAMMRVFQPLAVAGVVNCAFHLHCSALYVHDRADLVNWFNAANTGLLLGVGLALGKTHGVAGYLAAEIAALASYGLLVVLAKRSLGLPYPMTGVLWLAAAVAAISLAGEGWAACLILAAPALFSRGRGELRTLAEMLRSYRSMRLVPES